MGTRRAGCARKEIRVIVVQRQAGSGNRWQTIGWVAGWVAVLWRQGFLQLRQIGGAQCAEQLRFVDMLVDFVVEKKLLA